MKRVASLILSLLLSVTAFPLVYAETAEGQEMDADANLQDYQPYVNFVLALDMMDYSSNGKFDPESAANRGDLGTAIGRMLGRVQAGAGSGIPDVSVQTSKGSYISAAVQAGYMQLYTDGNFHSSEQITVKEALEAMITLLGYRSEAIASGDTSYRLTASKLKINSCLEGLADTDPLPRGILAELLYQTVHTEPLLVEGIGVVAPGENYGILKPAGEIYLEACMEIGAIHGIVEASADTYLVEGVEVEEDQVMIDGLRYQDTYHYAAKYVGYDTAVYYDKSEEGDGRREVYFAVPYRNINEVLTLNAADIYQINSISEIEYALEDGKPRKIRISSDAVYVYNGKPLSSSELTKEKLDIESGQIVLIANSNSSGYNVVIIYDEKNYLVNSINATRGEIICQKNYTQDSEISEDTVIEADEENGDYRVSFLHEGGYTTIEDVSENSVISVAESLDGKIKRITISDTSVDGLINKVQNSDPARIWIEDTAYTINPQYDSIELKAGNYVTLYLNYQGEIVYASTASSADEQYGYLIETASTAAFDDKYIFRIFAIESVPASVIEVEGADKIVVNGSGKNGKETVQFLMNQKKNPADVNEGVLIKFKLDNEGKLKRITTPEDVTQNPYVDQSKFLKQVDTVIYRRLGQLGPFYIDTNETLYVHIPSVKSSTDTDYRIGGAPADNASCQCIVYDVQPNMIPKVVVVPNSDPGASVPGSKAAFTVVNSVNKALDEDGNEVYQLECYQDKKLVTYNFGESVLNRDETTPDGFPETIATNGDNTVLGGKLWPWELECGDVIQLSTDHLGNIGSYKVLIRHDCMDDLAALGTTYREEVNGEPAEPVYDDKNSHLGNSRAYLGYTHVVDIVDGRLIFNPFKELGYPMVGNKSIAYSGKTVYVYNRTKETLRVGSSEDVYPGADMFFRDYNAGVKFDMVVIED